MSGSGQLTVSGSAALAADALSPSSSFLAAASSTSVKAKSSRPLTIQVHLKTETEKVFSRTVSIKVSFSQFAMHLDSNLKGKYFSRIDSFVDPEEWNSGDSLPSVDSFQDFLRAVILYRYPRLPELALNSDGSFAACWYSVDFRLTVEFIGKKRARWIVSRSLDGIGESAAGHCGLNRLRDVLTPYVEGRHIFQ